MTSASASFADELQDLILAGWSFWRDGERLRFRAPRAAADEAQLRTLRLRKADILALLDSAPQLFHAAPLSCGQRALWFLWLLAPDSIAYNQSMPLRLPLGADAARWRAACRILLGRHEVLRARFSLRNGEPIQTFALNDEVAWMESAADELDDGALGHALEASHGRPFDLENEAPLRCHWFSRRAAPAILLITLHHIACDAWSLEVMRQELQRIADGLRKEAPLPAPPTRQYRDFVYWQRDFLAGPEGDRLLAFWRQCLTPLPPPLVLPTDRPRPALLDYHGAAVSLGLSAELAGGLRELARQEEATPNVVLMTLFCVLLKRLSGQAEFVLGAPSAGRSLAEFAGVVGYFVDPLAIPVRMRAGASFRELLAQLRELSLAALAHRDMPFMRLVEKLQLPRDASRSPLFDVSFNFLSHHEQTGAPVLGTMSIAQADGKFDLTLTVVDHGSDMTASLGYNLALFDRPSVEEFAALLQKLGAAAVADPDCPIDLLARQAQPIEPVARGLPLAEAAAQRLQHAILAWVEKSPEAIAVVCGDERLSYRELGTRVEKLALALGDLGLSSDEVVAVCLPRSANFVAALLAVLSAGAAYLPLDPAHPAALRGQMLDLVRARWLLASRHAAVTVASWAGGILYIEDIVEAFDSRPLRLADVDSSALAYVIFTSGSTGVPKGVAISHAAISNYCASIRRDLEMSDGASGLVISALSADLGNTLLFSILIGGGTLHLADDDLATNPVVFAEYFQRHAIDYLKIVPSHLAALLHGRSPVLPRRALILGGEASASAWLAPLLACGRCRIFNHYGPTETTVGVLTHEILPEDLARHARSPLGRAIAGMTLYLLDDDCQPVWPGSPGELYVAGPGLAQGYVNDPAQTAERFVFLDGIGRAYRTGDRARRSRDGTLDILGRADRQLKVHGQRVELAHIENVLAARPEVAQCAVLGDREDLSVEQLLAWVVLRQDAAQSVANSPELEERLRHALADELPAYMVPARILFRDTLPVTSNGKLDSATLRAEVPALATDTVFARSPLEWRLARLWQEILGTPQVGVHEDFFRAGGHSLLAVRLMGRIAEEFDVRLPLATLMTHRTIAQIAGILQRVSPVTHSTALLALQEGAGGTPLVLLPGAGGNLLYFNALLQNLPKDLPIWGLQAVGLADDETPPETVEALAARYVQLLLATPGLDHNIALVGHSFGGLVAYEMALQWTAAGRHVSFLGVLDNAAPAADSGERYAQWSSENWLRHIALRIGKLYGVSIVADGVEAEGSHGERLFSALRRAGLVPMETRYAYFDRFIAIYRANVMAAATYQPRVIPMNISLSLFSARDADQALQRHTASNDPLQGWQGYVSTPVRHHVVPGTHISMLLPPNVGELAAMLSAELSYVAGAAL